MKQHDRYNFRFYSRFNHKLYKWLRNNNLTLSQFANLIDRSPRTVQRYMASESFPPMEVMAKIERITNYEVTSIDFIAQNKFSSPAIANVEYLKEQITINNVKQKELGYVLGITHVSISKKLKSSNFTKEEIIKLLMYISQRPNYKKY